jgi:uncharacterized protein DUF5318
VATESWWRLARAGPDALLCFDPCRHTLTTHSPAERSYATFDAVRRLDVCDAHPELLRAARNVGEPAPHDCPICGNEHVRYVSYVYGDTLKQANGRCITYPGELDKLDASFDEFACYVVEVCLDCRWNHLDRRYLLGRRHAG